MGTLDIEKFIAGLHEYLGKELSPLVERVKVLESQMAEIKAKGVLFRGVFKTDQTYSRGDLVVRQGSLWACTGDQVTEEPPSHHWTLVSKSHK
jgi:hypothetical protein